MNKCRKCGSFILDKYVYCGNCRNEVYRKDVRRNNITALSRRGKDPSWKSPQNRW